MWVFHCPSSSSELSAHGPLVVSKIRPDKQMLQFLMGEGIESLSIAPVYFLVDTGAALSMIESSVARHIGLRTVGQVAVQGIAGSPVKCPLYNATIELPVENEKQQHKMMPVPVQLAGVEKAHSTEHSGLLGRDFL